MPRPVSHGTGARPHFAPRGRCVLDSLIAIPALDQRGVCPDCGGPVVIFNVTDSCKSCERIRRKVRPMTGSDVRARMALLDMPNDAQPVRVLTPGTLTLDAQGNAWADFEVEYF